jgi:primosomal protein N' (replication factor Y)
MLNLPDFRSAERTFSLLTQVAGRTGRGYHPGRVIIQTYSPDNYAIRAAAEHDFGAFYEREIKERQKYGYPPFSTLIKLLYSGKIQATAQKEAERMHEILNMRFQGSNISILGPSAAFLSKLAGKYRYQIVIKIKKGKVDISDILSVVSSEYQKGWVVDVNPESLL